MNKITVMRNNKEFQAIQLEIADNSIINEKSKVLPGTKIIGNWHANNNDFAIIFQNELVDIRSPESFVKMYEKEDLFEPKEITINFNELKEYILGLSTEHEEYWATEQQLIASEIFNIFEILNIKGKNSFKKFCETLEN